MIGQPVDEKRLDEGYEDQDVRPPLVAMTQDIIMHLRKDDKLQIPHLYQGGIQDKLLFSVSQMTS